jgi:hypothetical protein
MLLFSANPAYIEETVSYVKLGSRRRVYVGFEDEDYKPTIQIINEEFNMSDWDRYDFTALVNRPKELNPYIGTALPIPDHYLGTLTDKQIIAFNKVECCELR